QAAAGRLLALQLAAHRPVALVRVDEPDPDVLGLRLADLHQELGELLRDLPLLLGRAALVPLDGDDRHFAQASAGSSCCTSRFFGSAPMTFVATSPFLNRMIVRIDMTS